jgi:peptidyl-prolyl cis-trans isomerase A (cyclophilin A)
MANSGPGTNGSQFYITRSNCGWTGAHCFFGHVVGDRMSLMLSVKGYFGQFRNPKVGDEAKSWNATNLSLSRCTEQA